MAKNTIRTYSTTAASNTDVGGVDIQGTAPASNMDDAVREVMSHLAETNAGTAPLDDTFSLCDPADATKKARFDVGSVTAGQTRVITLPDANITLPSGTYVTETGTQTLTNKTLTTPTISTPSITGPVTVTSTDAGAVGAPDINLIRDSASPAANDVLGRIIFYGKESAGNTYAYAYLETLISDPTTTSEDGRLILSTSVAGALSSRASIGAGLFMTGATGGDPGAGKINAAEVQENGVALGYKLTSGTAQATTSGTSIDFSSIPSWVKRITVQFVGVSTSGTSNPLIQIGDSGGIEATGYLGSGGFTTDTGTDAANYTTGFGIRAGTAAGVTHGTIVLTLANAATFTWVASGMLGQSNDSVTLYTAGSKSLTATLDRVRITTVNGTDTFDAGLINIAYE